MSVLTIEKVKELYDNPKNSKYKISKKLNVTFEELNEFMNENGITRGATAVIPVGRVPHSQSPIFNTETVTIEQLENMLRKDK